MATRSVIALRVGTARKPAYRAVYCHYDGYPHHQLPILQEHYNSADLTEKLITGGEISCLHTNLGWNRETRPTTGPLYYAERGDKDVEPLLFTDLESMFEHYRFCGCEHAYVFVPDIGWVHTDIRQHEAAEPDPDDFNYVGSPMHY